MTRESAQGRLAAVQPKRAPRRAQYLAAKPADPALTCATVEAAIRHVRALGSAEAADWPHARRRQIVGAVVGFLVEHAEHVERVERGCERLLLQAALLAGKAE